MNLERIASLPWLDCFSADAIELIPEGTFAYHSGFLPADRDKDATVNYIANALYQHALKGHITLLQYKAGFASYVYIARKTRLGREISTQSRKLRHAH